MEIENLKPEDLTPYKKNPRHNKEALEIVKISIKKNGFNQPIVTNIGGVICVGHTRWLAAKALGLETVPVYRKKMSEAEFIAYNLADNKSHEYSTWDNDLLSELMIDLQDLDETLLEATAFSEGEIEALVDTSDLDDIVGDTVVSEHTRGDGTPKAHIKQVQIFLDDITFPIFIENCEIVQAYMTTSNLTDTVYNAVEKVADEIRNLPKS